MERECKEGRVLLEFVKIKTDRLALQIPRADKTSSVIQTKLNSAHLARPIQPESFPIHASGNHKQKLSKVDMRQTLFNSLSFKKIPI